MTAKMDKDKLEAPPCLKSISLVEGLEAHVWKLALRILNVLDLITQKKIKTTLFHQYS